MKFSSVQLGQLPRFYRLAREMEMPIMVIVVGRPVVIAILDGPENLRRST